ncbi:MAG: hypothetical protein R3274_01345 [Desulfobacterales bacterium]|nr:hypothetical protein [Desulfobacterales bacterium]
MKDEQDVTEILLESGDLITDVLAQNHFRLAPESVSELTVDRSSVKSIQFNAPKLILKTYGGTALSEADGDGDGIPDYGDLCADTPIISERKNTIGHFLKKERLRWNSIWCKGESKQTGCCRRDLALPSVQPQMNMKPAAR